MLLLISALIVAGSIWWGVREIVRELRTSRDEAGRGRALHHGAADQPARGACRPQAGSSLPAQRRSAKIRAGD